MSSSSTPTGAAVGPYRLSGSVRAIQVEHEGALSVATSPQVEAAVLGLVDRLADVDPALRRRYAVERTVSCTISDLGVVWSGRLGADGLHDVTAGAAPRAQVRLTVDSDDLLALADGRLEVPAAVATGRLRVQAGPLDLLKLRGLL